jgi:predicted regulator of Ras-like GTPase activity (Roadblock/LC7/MglB family)
MFYEEELKSINLSLAKLLRESRARVVLLVDRSGELIARQGDIGQLDFVALATLAAGDIAATGELARLLGEKTFSAIFHQGNYLHLHLSPIGDKIVLVVIFDEHSPLGLVRLRVKTTSEELLRLFSAIFAKVETQKSGEKVFLEEKFRHSVEEEINNLFRD